MVTFFSMLLCFKNSNVLSPGKITLVFVLNLLAIGHSEVGKVLGTFLDEKPILLFYDKGRCSTAKGGRLPRVDKTHNVSHINFKKAINTNAITTMTNHQKIVNGSFANEGQFPIMASVHLDFGDLGNFL